MGYLEGDLAVSTLVMLCELSVNINSRQAKIRRIQISVLKPDSKDSEGFISIRHYSCLELSISVRELGKIHLRTSSSSTLRISFGVDIFLGLANIGFAAQRLQASRIALRHQKPVQRIHVHTLF